MNIQSVAGNKYYLGFLDGARGLAILMVILVHIGSLITDGAYLIQQTPMFINAGARGVQLLFILSAFSLFHSNSIKFPDLTKLNKDFCINFYFRRIIRLYPLWILISVLIILIKSDYNIYKFLLSSSFAFGFLRFKPNTEIIVGGWAVFSELVFYLVFPYLFVKVRNLSSALKILIISIFATALWRLLATIYNIPSENSFWFLFPLFQAYAFGIGIVIYYLYKARYVQIFLTTKWVNIVSLMSVYMISTGNFDTAVIGISLLFLCSFSKKSIISYIFNTNILKSVGRLSYSIFLCHFMIIEILDRYIHRSQITLIDYANEYRIMIWFAIVLMVSFIFSYFLHELIEIPILRKYSK